MRHFSMYPLMWAAACGETNVRLVGELGLVECEGCRAVVARAELLGRPA